MSALTGGLRLEVAVALVLVVFLTLGAVGLMHHELWRDEAEIWLIARDSTGIGDLLVNMGTEGHPALWYLLNFVLSRVTSDPAAMQGLNLLIGGAAALVFLTLAPFPFHQRVLFCLGYYALFEFTVISRSYALQLLLLLGFCARYRVARLDGWGASLLFLLANTTLFGTIFAAQIVVLELGCRLIDRRDPGSTSERLPLLPVALTVLGVAVGFGHTLMQSLAIGPDHRYAYRPGFDLDWVRDAVATIHRGFFPLPDLTTLHPWNSNLIDALPGGAGAWLAAVSGLLVLVVCVSLLRRDRCVLVVFLLGWAALLTLTLFVWYGSQRHHGQLFVWFLVCLWLAAVRRQGESAPQASPVLTVLLSLQLLAGGLLWAADLERPFSMSRAAAEYLSGPDLEGVPIVGSIDYAVEPITVHLEHPVFYPESSRFGTFLDWSDARRMVSAEEAVGAGLRLLRESGGDVALVLSYPPTLRPGDALDLGNGIRMHYVAAFTGAIVPDENYHVYRLSQAD